MSSTGISNSCRKYFFLLFIFSVCFVKGRSQDTAVFKSTADSVKFYQSLREEIDFLLDTLHFNKSYTDINLGAGNGYFTSRTSQAGSSNSQWYYSGSAGYYHKSGLSLIIDALLTPSGGTMTLFQTAVSPGYEYLKSSKWGFALSYTRYFNKDSLSFYTSPLVNDFYALVKYKGGWIQPILAADYGFGTQTDVKRYLGGRITRTSVIRANDFAIFTSVKHDFLWFNLFSQKDHLTFSPEIMLISGTDHYGLNRSLDGTPRFILFKARRNGNPGSSSSQQSGFALQQFCTYLNANETIGKFYLQPSFILSYTFQGDYQGWAPIFSMTAGVTF